MRNYIYLIIFVVLTDCSSNNPKLVFEDLTNLSITDSILNIDIIDENELFEGDFSIVLKTTESQIKLWLSEKPPLNNIKWHKGKIPFEIGKACKFNFEDRLSIGKYENGKSIYIGNDDLIKIMNDPNNYSCYKENCCLEDKNLRFRSGSLLIVQPQTGMVYYENWKF